MRSGATSPSTRCSTTSATFSIIDYVGGLQDLHARLIRCIGDPDVRFLEDPVRMLRAVVLAARLEFTIDEPILESIEPHKHEIARSAPPRLLEEYYKILRSGHAAEAFRQLRATGLLKEITPELAAAPERAVALASPRSIGTAPASTARPTRSPTRSWPARCSSRSAWSAGGPASPPIALERRIELGLLPIPRRDVERLQQIIAMQPRLLDIQRRPAPSERCCTARRWRKR